MIKLGETDFENLVGCLLYLPQTKPVRICIQDTSNKLGRNMFINSSSVFPERTEFYLQETALSWRKKCIGAYN